MKAAEPCAQQLDAAPAPPWPLHLSALGEGREGLRALEPGSWHSPQLPTQGGSLSPTPRPVASPHGGIIYMKSMQPLDDPEAGAQGTSLAPAALLRGRACPGRGTSPPATPFTPSHPSDGAKQAP